MTGLTRVLERLHERPMPPVSNDRSSFPGRWEDFTYDVLHPGVVGHRVAQALLPTTSVGDAWLLAKDVPWNDEAHRLWLIQELASRNGPLGWGLWRLNGQYKGLAPSAIKPLTKFPQDASLHAMERQDGPTPFPLTRHWWLKCPVAPPNPPVLHQLLEAAVRAAIALLVHEDGVRRLRGEAT